MHVIVDSYSLFLAETGQTALHRNGNFVHRIKQLWLDQWQTIEGGRLDRSVPGHSADDATA